MRFGYQPLGPSGRASGPRKVVRLCHRQLAPDDVATLLRRAGLPLSSHWGGFEGEPLTDGDGHLEQHVYLARRPGS